MIQKTKHKIACGQSKFQKNSEHNLSITAPCDLCIKNLCVETFSGKKLVDSVSFHVPAGNFYALVGESGSGKTLTALSIIRLLPDGTRITDGEITLHHDSLLDRPEKWMTQIRGKRIGMIFQNAMTALNPVMSVGNQLREAFRQHNQKLSSAQAQQHITRLMSDTGLPDTKQFLRCYPHQLSGGQLQRIVITMALCHRPQLIIADEPTTALDVTTQKNILNIIQRLTRKYQLTVLFITHDLTIARQMADKIGVMYQGKIIEEKETAAFFSSPEHPYCRKLLNSLSTSRTSLSSADNNLLLELDQVTVRYELTGRSWKNGWRKCFLEAASQVSFTVAKGETLALIGESGSGKSTIGNAILNLIPVSSGNIKFNHQEISRLNRREMLKFRQKIQMIFQSPAASLNPGHTVREILEEGMISLRPDWSASYRKQKIHDMLTLVCLEDSYSVRYPGELSGGQQQRIAIARALIIEPELLICDEPTSSLDMSIRQEIIRLLASLQSQTGTTYLIITHDLAIVPQIAQKVAVMQKGWIVEQGAVDQVLKNPAHDYTKLLINACSQLSV